MTAVPERAVFSVALNHNLTLSRIGSARQSNEQAGWIQKKNQNIPILAEEHFHYEQCTGMPAKLILASRKRWRKENQ